MANETRPPVEAKSLYTPPEDIKSRLKASYDAIAPKYNEWTIPHSAVRLNYLSQLLSHLPTTTPVSILELGCGNGVPVTKTLLSHPNFTIIANDISTSQLDLARASLLPNPHLTLLDGDMLCLDFPSASLDAVLGFYSVIHLPRDEQVVMLGKIVQWLKPGGWFLANFGAAEAEGIEAEKWLEEEKGWMFWSGWGAEGTIEKVREVGLEVVVKEVLEDTVDKSKFLWVLAKKS